MDSLKKNKKTWRRNASLNKTGFDRLKIGSDGLKTGSDRFKMGSDQFRWIQMG